MKSSAKRCYLCGSSGVLTREHVPPKSLFPRPRPSNLSTVPCCNKCNNSASKDDEYFRFACSSLINANPHGRRSWQRLVASTLKHRRIEKLIDRVRGGMKPVRLVTSAGAVPAAQLAFEADVINRVLVRITKGFLYLTHPEIDRSKLDFHVTQIDQFKLHSIVASGVATALATYSVGDGVYRHWRGLVDEDNRNGLWIHMFYEAAVWMIQHEPGDDRVTVF